MRVPIFVYRPVHVCGGGESLAAMKRNVAFDFLDDLGRRGQQRVLDEVAQQVLLQALSRRSGTRLVGAMHTLRDVPDLDRGHSAIIALVHVICMCHPETHYTQAIRPYPTGVTHCRRQHRRVVG